jgi:hypothetical protein
MAALPSLAAGPPVLAMRMTRKTTPTPTKVTGVMGSVGVARPGNSWRA